MTSKAPAQTFSLVVATLLLGAGVPDATGLPGPSQAAKLTMAPDMSDMPGMDH